MSLRECEKEDVSVKLQPLELRTPRLCLRQIREEDAPMIVQLRSDPLDYRFFRLPHQLTIEEHLQWYKGNYLQNMYRFDWLALCEDKPVGLFGLNRLPEDMTCAEISYLLAGNIRGKGYAGEAAGALLQWSARAWQLKRFFAEIHKENEASIHFIERMGFDYWKEEDPFLFYRKEL